MDVILKYTLDKKSKIFQTFNIHKSQLKGKINYGTLWNNRTI